MSLIIESLTGGSWTLGTGPPNHLVHRNFSSRLSIPITDVPSTNVVPHSHRTIPALFATCCSYRAAGLLLVPGTAQEGALFSGHRSRRSREIPPEKVVASSQPFALSLNRWTPNGRQAPQELIMLFVASSFDDRTFCDTGRRLLEQCSHIVYSVEALPRCRDLPCESSFTAPSHSWSKASV